MNLERYAVIRRIAGPRALSQWVFLPILATLSAGTSIPQLQLGATEFYAWNSVAAGALAGAWTFASLAGLLINAVLPQPTVVRFFAVVVIYFATEAGRAVLVAWQAQALGLDADPNWSYRIVAGGLTGLALFGLASSLANESYEYRENLSKLMQTKTLLAETVATTSSDLEVRRAKLLERVRSAVTDSIRSVLSTGGSSAREVADELVRVSEEVIRPLSHSLIPASEPQPDVASGPPAPMSLRSVMHHATYVQPFRPEAVTIFALLLTAGAVVFVWPLTTIPVFVALLAWVYGSMATMRRFITPRLVSMSFAWRVIVLTVAYLVFAIVPGLILLLATDELSVDSWPYFAYIVVIGQIVLWPLAIIAGVRETRASVINDLRYSNERLCWSRARLASYLWGQQSNLAGVLHKDVQGTLLASAMRLKMSRDDGKNDADAIDEIRSAVLEASEFVVAPAEAKPVAEAVSTLNSRWQGVFRVDLGGSATAIARLDSDHVCRRIAIDLLSEFVTNAVKHGQATSATASVSLVESDVVRLDGTNNGRALSGRQGSGLGTRMLSAVSLQYGFDNVPGGVRLWADIPIV